MNYLLDTCVLSEFLKKLPNQDVLEWFEEQDDSTLYISVLAIGEIQKGIAKLTHSRRKSELKQWLNGVVERFDRRILPFTISSANIWGEMKADLETNGRILPVIDSLMAAIALEHGITIVTRNEEDFAATGVKVLNLWQ
jgi:predicted nucleic acid-binding protein